MEQYQFLSPKWIAKARAIRESHRSEVEETNISIRMNQLVTDIPFGESELRTYVDTSSGLFEIDLGELENPDISLVLDYATAKAIFVDLDPQVGLQAFMAGKIKVTGDLTKLMALQGSMAPNDTGLIIAEQIKAITL